MQAAGMLQTIRCALSIVVIGVAVIHGGSARATLCGSVNYPFPYNDVAGVSDAFCPGIMEAYVLGVTRGTTATTFTPNQDVPRLQMTTFLQRSIDQTLKRSHPRAALGQWWTAKTGGPLAKTQLPEPGPGYFCKSDGEVVWVSGINHIASVSARTGQVLAQWSGGSESNLLVANGSAYLSLRSTIPANGLARLPRLVEPPYFTVPISTPNLGYGPHSLAFDGERIWTADYAHGTVTIVSMVDGDFAPPFTPVPGFTFPLDIVYDGANMWVVEALGANRIRKLDANGGVLQTVAVGNNPGYPVFDGTNLWVPNRSSNSITVVQAATGSVVATIASNAGNRLSAPLQAAFDGERILVTNAGNDSVTLFRAADLALIGNVQLPPGSLPAGACSDGLNFWVALEGVNQLVRL